MTDIHIPKWVHEYMEWVAKRRVDGDTTINDWLIRAQRAFRPGIDWRRVLMTTNRAALAIQADHPCEYYPADVPIALAAIARIDADNSDDLSSAWGTSNDACVAVMRSAENVGASDLLQTAVVQSVVVRILEVFVKAVEAE